MSMFSTITTAPAKQSVSETIPVLSGRLSTATLLEDRRAAILGLRSFAKQYPASVASGALRSLIGSLSRDGEDVDTVKVALETLLMLFSPDLDSPEASEEIALWVADEFTQRHENIALLLGFLGNERTDFYSRLYSLQLLSAILSARTERTEECIVNTNDGISRLVAVLEDPREAIRDEAINLLTDLTPTSNVVQNLVTLEKGFAPIFETIGNEDGLAGGARVVEDCLILLANLLRLNPLNQTMFRDMGHVAELSRLLRDAYKGGEDGQEVAQWVEVQRSRNVYAMLAVIRLLLVPGAAGTHLNQEAFVGDLVSGGRTRVRGGPVLENTLQIAFSHAAELPIKSEALLACADMIRGNAEVQARFAGFQVPSPLVDPTAANGHGAQLNGIPKVYIIDGLLDLVLAVSSLPSFDLRMAACTCLKAYFFKHAEIRMHFLDHAVRTHKAHADEVTNALTILLQPNPEAATVDPYRYWFAAVLILHLVHDNPETKALAMSVTEGDEASGEEVVTSIQTMTAHLLSGVAKSEDPRISIGYLMLLSCWLFEDLEGVNDFLGEFTNLQGLIQAAIENPNGDIMVQGLSAMLAGVVYEFSTKDSPVPRTKVREMIISRMGRDRYVDKLSRLRSHPLMRDHEVIPQKLEDQKLPDVYFDDTFVDFFKDNYSRILRAIDRDPDLETSVITNGVQKGVSRTLVDALRAEAADKSHALQEAQTQTASLADQLAQEQAAHERTKAALSTNTTHANDATAALRQQLAAKESALQSADAAATALTRQLAHEQQEHQRARAEAARLQTAHDALQRGHAQELAALQARLRQGEEVARKSEEAARKSAEQEAERARRRAEADMADLRATISRLEVDLMKASKAKTVVEGRVAVLEGEVKGAEAKVAEVERELKGMGGEVKKAVERAEKAEERVAKAGGEVEEVRARAERVEREVKEARKRVEEKEEARKGAQSELDDMLEVFGDLEEKVTKYKERLKALGQEVSDGEDDDDDEDGDDDDDEEE
ncbi:p115 like vesicle tethering protein [Chaetomidium leptoderma]|uniref:P115 like vesicle tethering protein n=1 Tax=Chaetomidium leptoderma TaxID=669021 RepID=A0AAN6VM74_9PEZI|nr:p115 like vesicle tethering protein [Chaetomidium leptoderma]